MKITGYGDQLGVAQGETIRFMVSSDDEYDAQLVRPSHRPDLRSEIEAPLNGRYPGQLQALPMGSYIRFDDPVPRPRDFQLAAWVMPTFPARGNDQELLVWGGKEGLFLNEAGEPELRLAGQALATGTPLRRGEWYLLTTGVESGQAFVEQEPQRWAGAARAESGLPTEETSLPFRIGYGFDGKIDSPRIDGVAAWDFSIGIQTLRVNDTGHRQLHGDLVNMPMRAVTGHNWTGREVDFRLVPEEYGAIHFHHDDLDDCRWESDFSLEVPADLPSGLYAIRLSRPDAEDHIPFFVRPPRGQSKAPIAFLAPTFSYLAYANEHFDWDPGQPGDERPDVTLGPEDAYAHSSGLLSAYDYHADGTGNCFASRLRPLVNMRPYYSNTHLEGPHQVGADLHILDWMTTMGHAYDVVTDDDLHEEGTDLLSRYRAVVSGTHPEYWSGPMLEALESWVHDGGRFMYMGGNGLYWVTCPHPQAKHLVEIRRTNQGSRAWESGPGEYYTQGTADLGGMWKYRGRAPQRYVGVGMSAHGHDGGRPYRREADSHDPRASWIFAGVAADAKIGDFGATLGAAGGFELDRIDHALGSPPQTLHLATADGFTDQYQAVIEEVVISDSRQAASMSDKVHADAAYFEAPNGGGVFSTGSITWGTSLTHNGCDNDVSRITNNVLTRFSS